MPATERINTGYSSKVTWVTHLFANFVGYPFSVATQFLLASREGSSGHSCQESDLDEAFFTLPSAARRAGMQKEKKKTQTERETKGFGEGDDDNSINTSTVLLRVKHHDFFLLILA